MKTCQRCESHLDAAGLCQDQTCPFHAFQQSDRRGWEGHPNPPSDDLLAIYRQIASERLRADQGWARAQMKADECNQLRERLAALHGRTDATPANKVVVDAAALRQVLSAFAGDRTHVSELYVIAHSTSPNNPIMTLVDQFNDQVSGE